MQRGLATPTKPAAPGIMDTIAAGFSVALAQPLLMIVPMLVDLYYWIGWRISPRAFTDELQRLVLDSDVTDATDIAADIDRAGGWDLMGAVSIVVPSMLGGLDRDRLYELWNRPALNVGSWWLVLLAAVGIVAAAAWLFMAYCVPLADAAVGRSRSVASFVRAVSVAWLRFLALIGVIIGLALLVFGPAVVVTAVLQLAGINIAPLLIALSVFVGIAALVYLYFVVDAIVVTEVGPLRAMYYSVNVVRRNFWQSVGFVAAAFLISTGLPEVWSLLVGNPPGLLIAVVAHAFFAGGLAMASMMFYNDRLRQWRPEAAVGIQLTR